MHTARMRSISLLVICFVASVAVAQQKIPPPPKPPDDGPTLEVTMKFIFDKIGEQGTFNVILAVHAPAKTRIGAFGRCKKLAT